MITIDYLNAAISASFSLRKVKNIIIEQKDKEFRMRPQNHLLVVSPFGTFKSSITQQLRKKSASDIYVNDDFTKPSIEGSISKDGEYVPSILINVGGKIFVIDEWNSVGPFGQGAMLSILENQESSRSLGFKVKTPYHFRDKCGYVDYDVKDNTIKIKAIFSCIAYAMEYPIYDNSQKAKALLSRFSPLFIQPTKEFIKAGTRGQFKIDIQDHCKQIDNVTIPFAVYEDLYTKYYEYVDKHDLWPKDEHDYGFISRTLAETVRYGIHNYLGTVKETKLKEVIVPDSAYFEQSFDFINTLMTQFINPETKDKIFQYKKLKDRYPQANKTQLGRLLGVSIQTISNYEEKITGIKQVDDIVAEVL